MRNARTAMLATVLGIVFAGLFSSHPVNGAEALCSHAADNSVGRLQEFTYRPSCSKTPIRVKNGVFERTKPDRFYFKIGNIAYGDIGGDGSTEAIVLSACNSGGSGVFSEGFVFGLVNGQVNPASDYQRRRPRLGIYSISYGYKWPVVRGAPGSRCSERPGMLPEISRDDGL